MRSEHSFPPLRAGLNIYLTLYLDPEASGALHLDHSDTIHGSGTVNNYNNYHITHSYLYLQSMTDLNGLKFCSLD